MSSGLEQYEQTVAGFGNAMDSIRSFTATYDTDFFRDWTEKHNLAMEKLKTAGDVSGGVGGAYIAGKLAYQKIQKLRKGDDDEDDEDENEEPNTDDHDGDEDGRNDTEDGSVGEEAETEGAEASTEATATEASTAAEPVSSLGAGEAVDASGVIAGDVEPLGASATPVTEAQAAQFTQDPVADPLGSEPPSGAAPTPPAAETEGGLGEEPDLLSTRAQIEQGTGYEAPEEFNPSPTSGELTSSTGETTVAEGTESTLETGTATAGDAAATAGSTGADIAATAGSEVLDTALTVAGAAAEAVPFLGIFAGIGIGLYELFHHPKAAPSAPPISTANSKGEMVLPSYDSVTDTPASASAF